MYTPDGYDEEMLNPSLKAKEITLDSSFNEFNYRYNLQTISSEESWLGIDLLGNDPSSSWWTVSGNEFRTKHWNDDILLSLKIKTGSF